MSLFQRSSRPIKLSFTKFSPISIALAIPVSLKAISGLSCDAIFLLQLTQNSSNPGILDKLDLLLNWAIFRMVFGRSFESEIRRLIISYLKDLSCKLFCESFITPLLVSKILSRILNPNYVGFFLLRVSSRYSIQSVRWLVEGSASKRDTLIACSLLRSPCLEVERTQSQLSRLRIQLSILYSKLGFV